ncbi:phosphotransferase [Paenibacillus lentus]|uniref:Aminoglycoside phosphotransferase n=1 Tax=Paenibacillus lentus TaxID=1338368 RepID=A0A3Q8S5D0_9BACL|nr:phosphotransferase [Paenibacillus lentus]AZK47294.1 aminoglycoside phosphotransferase [Paenibacillus lentus]
MLNSILNHYPQEYIGDAQQGASGWNNTTYFIQGSRRRCVLRIYETHQDIDKIRFEHAVLQELNQFAVSFRVPMPIRTITDETIVKLEDGSGRYACMFEYIVGLRPEGDSVRAAFSFGEAAGELLMALSAVEPGLPPAYRPYYELSESYPACSPDVVLEFCTHPPEPFKDLQESLSKLARAYLDLLQKLDGLEKLPQQLIHGDLNYSNLLVDTHDPGRVTALLDFEFCTKDVLAMEPAVIISGLLGQGDHEDRETVKLFCEGFGGRVRLMPEEIEAIPLFMRLRQIDVFLHFLSRFFNGTDDPLVLRKQVKSTAAELRQLEQNDAWFTKILMQYISL